MYILRGQPDEIKVGTSVSYSYGGTGQGNNFVFTNTDTHPSELWRYRNIDGKAANVAYEFIDRQKNGEYTLEYDPGSKSK
jgi:hypothetical protein